MLHINFYLKNKKIVENVPKTSFETILENTLEKYNVKREDIICRYVEEMKISDIHTGDGEYSENIYAEVKDYQGFTMISATLDYIIIACASRGYNIDLIEATKKYVRFCRNLECNKKETKKYIHPTYGEVEIISTDYDLAEIRLNDGTETISAHYLLKEV